MSDYGVMGGSSFAVSATSEISTEQFKIYWAFRDSSLGNGTAARYGWWANGGCPQYCTIYNPNPLKISSIQIQNSLTDTNGAWKEWHLQGSNDGSYYESVASGQNTVYGTAEFWTMNISSTKFYNYHRLIISSLLTYSIPRCSRITLNATQLTSSSVGVDVWVAPNESNYYIKF